jgi:hypothetical protein
MRGVETVPQTDYRNRKGLVLRVAGGVQPVAPSELPVGVLQS